MILQEEVCNVSSIHAVANVLCVKSERILQPTSWCREACFLKEWHVPKVTSLGSTTYSKQLYSYF